MNIEDALKLFLLSLDGVVSPATIKWYCSRLKPLVEFLPGRDIATITINELRAWRASLAHRAERWSNSAHRPATQGGLTPESIHCHVRACQRFFKWLVDEELLVRNPARRLEKPKLPVRRKRGIPETARDAIIEAARQASARDYAIVLLLADTAARAGGLAGLRLEDLELGKRRAIVTEKGKGGGKQRPVFMTPRTVAAIEAYIKVRPHGATQHLFLAERSPHAPLNANGIYQVCKRLAAAAGVPAGWNPHNWRHGAIRAMLENGMPLPAASEIAGHSSTQVTGDIYGSYPEDALQRMHDRYTWLPQDGPE